MSTRITILFIEFDAVSINPNSIACVCALITWMAFHPNEPEPIAFSKCSEVNIDDVLAVTHITSRSSRLLAVIGATLVQEYHARNCSNRQSPTTISHSS